MYYEISKILEGVKKNFQNVQLSDSIQVAYALMPFGIKSVLKIL